MKIKTLGICLIFALIIKLTAALIIGGVDAAERRYIFEVTAVNNESKVSTVFQVYAPDERQAGENVRANGWKVISVKQLDVPIANQTGNKEIAISTADEPVVLPSKYVVIDSVLHSSGGYIVEDVTENGQSVSSANNSTAQSDDEYIDSILGKKGEEPDYFTNNSVQSAERANDPAAAYFAAVADPSRMTYITTVYFNLSMTDPVISGAAASELNAISKNSHIYLFGHTDNVAVVGGTQNYSNNFDLSIQRAEAVKDYLMKLGINSANITAIGMGSLYPAAKNTGGAGGTVQNRRVDIYGYK